MQPEFIVMSDSSADQERFAVFRTSTMFERPFRWSSVTDIVPNVERLARTLDWMSDSAARLQLLGMGLAADAIDEQIRRARRTRELMQKGAWTIEHVTQIGYRNEHGQEVLRKTDLPVSAGRQRVYVLRCGECGNQHGADGRDIAHVQCPSCQDGPPPRAIHHS